MYSIRLTVKKTLTTDEVIKLRKTNNFTTIKLQHKARKKVRLIFYQLWPFDNSGLLTDYVQTV